MKSGFAFAGSVEEFPGSNGRTGPGGQGDGRGAMNMSSDAKLGLLAGIAAVLLIAVVYHRKPQTSPSPAGNMPATNGVNAPPEVSVVPRVHTLSTDPLVRENNEPEVAPPSDPIMRGPGQQ